MFQTTTYAKESLHINLVQKIYTFKWQVHSILILRMELKQFQFRLFFLFYLTFVFSVFYEKHGIDHTFFNRISFYRCSRQVSIQYQSLLVLHLFHFETIFKKMDIIPRLNRFFQHWLKIQNTRNVFLSNDSRIIFTVFIKRFASYDVIEPWSSIAINGKPSSLYRQNCIFNCG